MTVMRINRIAMDELVEADGSSRHVNLLVQLEATGRALGEGKATRPPDA
jgi:hypothetical protein